MSLRPVKGKHGTRARRARLSGSSHGNWGEWKFSVPRPNGEFNPFWSSRKGKAIILILFSMTSFLLADQALKGTHAYQCVTKGPDKWLNCDDPLSYIWSATSPNNDTSEFNTVRTTYTTCPVGPCSPTQLAPGEKLLDLAPNGTQAAIALSKNPVGDLGILSAKQMFLRYEYAVLSGSCCAFGQSHSFGVFLTTNKTLPTQLNYDPYRDKSVALLSQIFVPSAGTYLNALFIQRNQGETVQSEDPGGCPPSSSCYITGNDNINPATTLDSVGLILNFTTQGNTSGSCTFVGGVIAGPGCNWIAKGPGISVPPTFAFSSQTTPLFRFHGTYYIGFYSLAGNSAFTLGFDFEQTVAALRPMDLAYYVPGSFCPGQANGPCNPDTGGFFGPLITGIINFGIWFFANAIPFLQAVYTFIFNSIGSIWGDPSFGTHLIAFISTVIAFIGDPNNGLVAAFNNFAAIFARFFDGLKIVFPWLPIALSIALNVMAFALNGITFGLTLISLFFKLVVVPGVGLGVMILIVLYFVMTGDDALGGLVGWIETLEWAVFNIGLGWTAKIVNYGLDIITAIIGFTPKPFIQMVAHRFPRLPIIEVNAHWVNPSFSLSEMRNGNMLAVALWMVGIDFMARYNAASGPFLPGSIGALNPTAGANITGVLNGLLPLLDFMVVLSGLIAIGLWPFIQMMNIVGFSLSDEGIPFIAHPGRRISRGPGGFRVRASAKRFHGRLNKKFGVKVKEGERRFDIAGRKIAERAEKEAREFGRGLSLSRATGGQPRGFVGTGGRHAVMERRKAELQEEAKRLLPPKIEPQDAFRKEEEAKFRESQERIKTIAAANVEARRREEENRE